MRRRKAIIPLKFLRDYFALIFRNPAALAAEIRAMAEFAWRVAIRRRSLVVVERGQAGIGDLICVFASLPAIRRRIPRAWVLFVAAPSNIELARAIGLADAIAFNGGLFHRLARWLSARGHYYRAVLPDELQPPRSRQRIHLAEEFARGMGVEANLDAVQPHVPLKVAQTMRSRIALINPGKHTLVIVQPGPTWPVKAWPDSHWEELGTLLRAESAATVIQIGLDVDSFTREPRQTVRVPGAIDWVNQLDLVETMALVAEAQLFIGPDSGPLHLATTLGIPAIGLFGPTDGRFIVHPRAPVILLSSDVPCLGCHYAPGGPLHWRTGCPFDIRCMRQLTVNTVLNAVKSALGNSEKGGL